MGQMTLPGDWSSGMSYTFYLALYDTLYYHLCRAEVVAVQDQRLLAPST